MPKSTSCPTTAAPTGSKSTSASSPTSATTTSPGRISVLLFKTRRADEEQHLEPTPLRRLSEDDIPLLTTASLPNHPLVHRLRLQGLGKRRRHRSRRHRHRNRLAPRRSLRGHVARTTRLQSSFTRIATAGDGSARWSGRRGGRGMWRWCCRGGTRLKLVQPHEHRQANRATPHQRHD